MTESTALASTSIRNTPHAPCHRVRDAPTTQENRAVNEPIDITWPVVLAVAWLVASLFLTSWLESRCRKHAVKKWLRFWDDE